MTAMPTRAVTLDAFGTLIAMDPPAPLLSAALADDGYAIPADVVEDALRREIAHYRARMHIGADAAGVEELRAECGAVLADALGPAGPDPATATQMLLRSLRFRLHHDVPGLLDALEARGVRMAVVSNWDAALAGHLHRLGVADRLAVVLASAAVGAAKPDPEIFLQAARAMDVDPAAVLHVGDRRREDYEGARAAGMRAVLLDRTGTLRGPDVVHSLDQVATGITP
ncbi:MAG: HAD family hydrolase [Miltoncostaeaceae bacterium]